jgi:WD40 repeat protein
VLLHTLDAPPSVWNAVSGERLYTLDGHTGMVTAVRWTPDNTQIITVGTDGTIRFWDASTGAHLRTLDARASLWSAEFSPDGFMIASTADDGSIRLWNARSGREVQFIFPPAANATPNLTVTDMDLTTVALALR